MKTNTTVVKAVRALLFRASPSAALLLAACASLPAQMPHDTHAFTGTIVVARRFDVAPLNRPPIPVPMGKLMLLAPQGGGAELAHMVYDVKTQDRGVITVDSYRQFPEGTCVDGLTEARKAKESVWAIQELTLVASNACGDHVAAQQFSVQSMRPPASSDPEPAKTAEPVTTASATQSIWSAGYPKRIFEAK